MRVELKRRFMAVSLFVVVIIAFALPDRRESTSESALSKRGWISPMTLLFDDLMFDIDRKSRAPISIYDGLLRSVSISMGNDWRLMAAIAYVESRFQPDVHSHTGAVGLMQIMPRTGAHYGCSRVELLDPWVNIMVANLLYNDICKMLKMPADIADRDQMALALASYNGGIGHIFDAFRLTRMAGGDPHLWSDVVPHLLSLRHESIYNNPIVRNGSFATAGSTVRYVRDVLKKYDEFVSTIDDRLHLYPYAIRFEGLDLDDNPN